MFVWTIGNIEGIWGWSARGQPVGRCTCADDDSGLFESCRRYGEFVDLFIDNGRNLG